MANDYTETDNYGLSLYGDTTPADFRDGYNNSMRIIDTQMKTNNDATANGISAKNILNHINWNTEEEAAAWINNAETSETQTTANTNALTALNAETVEKATTIKNRIYNKKRIILFGDSWTQYHDRRLGTKLNAVANYGVSGARMDQIATQINSATTDANATDIIMIFGTNNVFWEHTFNPFEWATDISTALQAKYPNAKYHYFPNNSKTFNYNRNNLYSQIINSMTTHQIIAYPDSLYYNWINNLQNYLGDDQEGVQHLSESGTDDFANYILTAIEGYKPLPVRFGVKIKPTEGSKLKVRGDNDYATLYITVDTSVVNYSANIPIDWADGITNKKDAFWQFEINLTVGADACPVYINAVDTCQYGNSNVPMSQIIINKNSDNTKAYIQSLGMSNLTADFQGSDIYINTTVANNMFI